MNRFLEDWTPRIRDVLSRRKLTGIRLKNLGGKIDDFVIFKKLFRFKKIEKPKTDAIQVGSRMVSLLMVHHPRARRYLLRLRPDGTARVTIPRNGSIRAARDFAIRNVGWLEQQFQRLAARPKIPDTWNLGTEILFRGELVRIEPDAHGSIHLGIEQLNVSDAHVDLRPAIQKHLRALASKELPPRVIELAALHRVNISRVTVRNQKSRWGSCSWRGTIALNWRLIQAPDFVRDYIILHELAHRQQMNHSEKFWQEVELICPDYLQAERWLRQHPILLRRDCAQNV